MKNPIYHSDIFATPADMEGLMSYCEQFTGGERMAAFVAAGMAWNLAHKLFEEAIKKEQSK
jgi:hypothetical protein